MGFITNDELESLNHYNTRYEVNDFLQTTLIKDNKL